VSNYLTQIIITIFANFENFMKYFFLILISLFITKNSNAQIYEVGYLLAEVILLVMLVQQITFHQINQHLVLLQNGTEVLDTHLELPLFSQI